jgi:hypothetical protein
LIYLALGLSGETNIDMALAKHIDWTFKKKHIDWVVVSSPVLHGLFLTKVTSHGLVECMVMPKSLYPHAHGEPVVLVASAQLGVEHNHTTDY